MEFIWDTLKSIANLQKHRVSFEEAETVFSDPLAIIMDDQQHSEQELREIIIGHSDFDRLLFISFTERSEGIRLIGAREATRQERKNMKTTFLTEVPLDQVLPDSLVEELTSDGLLPEYDIDYSKTKPNRFAARTAAPQSVKLDADVAAVFNTDESVNRILRALIQAMPQAAQRKTS